MPAPRNLIPILLILLSACKEKPNNELQQEEKKLYKVIRIVDGDTFIFLNEKGEKERLRLIGINAPECHHPQRGKEYGCEQSSQLLKSLIENQEVELQFDKQRKDKYQRSLAYVFLQDKTFVNEQLVLNGWAESKSYRPNTAKQDILDRAERIAKEEQIGIWEPQPSDLPLMEM